MIGAPAVAMVGGFYVAELLGAGREAAVVAAAGMIAAVVAANARGVESTARMQLGLAGVLAALLLVAVVSALPESRAANWTPFAPHGWGAVGTAASLLMLSFIGWEAVSHLAGELRDPARQLPRAIFAALAIVVVLYLGLAVATIGVLGTAAPSDVPLADLMAAGLGSAGRSVTAGLAVLLTMGAMNAYVAAAVKLSGALAAEGAAPRALARPAARPGAVRSRRGRAARAARVRRDRRRRARARVQRGVRGGLRRRHRGRRAAARRGRAGRRGRRVRGGHGRARVQRRVPRRCRWSWARWRWPVVRGARRCCGRRRRPGRESGEPAGRPSAGRRDARTGHPGRAPHPYPAPFARATAATAAPG